MFNRRKGLTHMSSVFSGCNTRYSFANGPASPDNGIFSSRVRRVGRGRNRLHKRATNNVVSIENDPLTARRL